MLSLQEAINDYIIIYFWCTNIIFTDFTLCAPSYSKGVTIRDILFNPAEEEFIDSFMNRRKFNIKEKTNSA